MSRKIRLPLTRSISPIRRKRKATSRATSKDKRDREQQAIEKSLQSTKTPKNWDYVMKVKAGSETITPNYAYDDGIFTYLGFAPNKTFPAAFLLEGSTESLLNTNVKQDGNYQVLVIQKQQKNWCYVAVRKWSAFTIKVTEKHR